MNSKGSILWDEESTNISKIAIIGKIAIVDKPIFHPDNLLTNFTLKPLKSNRLKLQIEIPSNPVLISGNNGESYCFKSGRKNVGSTIEITPKIDAKK